MTTTSPPRTAVATAVPTPPPWPLACFLLCLLSFANIGFIDAFVSNSLLSTSSPTATIARAPYYYCPSKATPSALKYASQAADGPMSKVDSTKSGGCPFLTTSYVYKTYAVPALFNDAGECVRCMLDWHTITLDIIDHLAHSAMLIFCAPTLPTLSFVVRLTADSPI